jgi:midasin
VNVCGSSALLPADVHTTACMSQEKGGATVEEVVAHPDFLVMATMNPGGDFGKRELSPALRNRFTEVWVPHVADPQDVEMLIREKLERAVAKAALRAELERPAQVRLVDTFVPVILRFMQWFGAVDSRDGVQRDAVTRAARDIPITLRDVQSWAQFLAAATVVDGMEPWLAFLHGVGMVLLDGLALGSGAGARQVRCLRLCSALLCSLRWASTHCCSR